MNSNLNVAGLSDAQTWMNDQLRANASTQKRVEDNWSVIRK
jgi:hypothetical protein